MEILANLPYRRIPKTDGGGQRSSRLHIGRLEEVGNPGSRIVDGLIGKPGMDIRHLIIIDQVSRCRSIVRPKQRTAKSTFSSTWLLK